MAKDRVELSSKDPGICDFNGFWVHFGEGCHSNREEKVQREGDGTDLEIHFCKNYNCHHMLGCLQALHHWGGLPVL